MAGDAADDLVDAVTLGPLRRKVTGYTNKVNNAEDKVRDAWRGSPLKRAIDSASDAYTKYKNRNKKFVAGERERSLGFYPKSDAPKKKAPQRKRVATKK
jgi:hypothetical protein